jgi:hypothetical protein
VVYWEALGDRYHRGGKMKIISIAPICHDCGKAKVRIFRKREQWWTDDNVGMTFYCRKCKRERIKYS